MCCSSREMPNLFQESSCNVYKITRIEFRVINIKPILFIFLDNWFVLHCLPGETVPIECVAFVLYVCHNYYFIFSYKKVLHRGLSFRHCSPPY